MADRRKLQAEIDRCLKKVDEGVEHFEELWQKATQATNTFHNAANQNQKEKYEGDLKKEIKKLQRHRDQIKTWLASSDIKDKQTLKQKRKLIETQMERFKVIERETKTKAYSKEGLGNPQKMDPKEKEREELNHWLASSIESLSYQVELFESELESISNGSKKKKLDKEVKKTERADELKVWLEKHRNHVSTLEKIMRMLDNNALEVSQVKNIKEDVEYYIESNQDPDFEENEFIYDELDLDEVGNIVMPPGGSHEDLPAGAGHSQNTPNHSGSPSPSPSLTNHSSDTNNHREESGKRARHRSDSDEHDSVISTLHNAPNHVHNHSSSLSTPPSAASTTATTTTSMSMTTMTTTLPLVSTNGRNRSNSANSIPSSGGSKTEPSTPKAIVPTLAFSAGSVGSGSALSGVGGHTPDRSIGSSAPSTPHVQHYAAAAAQAQAAPFSGAIVNTSSSSNAFEPESTPPTPAKTVPSAVLPSPVSSAESVSNTSNSSGSTVHNHVSYAAASSSGLISILGQGGVNSSGVTPSAGSTVNSLPASQPAPLSKPVSMLNGPMPLPRQGDNMSTLRSIAEETLLNAGLSNASLHAAASSVPSLSGLLEHTSLSLDRETTPALQETHIRPILWLSPLGSIPLTDEHKRQMRMLEAAGSETHMPQPSDSERARLYFPRAPVNPPPYYPRVPPSHSDSIEFFKRLSPETLFFIFYYMECACAAPLAQGTKAQYLAAKALKHHSWRFHTKYMMWFQRSEEPKTITDEFEVGTYFYFDFEKWQRRKKEGFTFEYRYLEDQELT